MWADWRPERRLPARTPGKVPNMGWTHDFREASQNRRATAARTTPPEVTVPEYAGHLADPRLGIPHILRRRARWVSARLRHSRT